jgi:hypothetical protein
LEHPIFFTPLEEFAKENIRYQQIAVLSLLAIALGLVYG